MQRDAPLQLAAAVRDRVAEREHAETLIHRQLVPSRTDARPHAHGDRHLERRPLHALRRAARRRAPRRAAAARRRASAPSSPPTRTAPARPTRCSAARSRASTATRTASSAPSGTTSTRASARARRASRASPTRGCAARTVTPTTCAWRPSARSSASAPTASTCCCCTTPTAPATRATAVWDGMAALRDAGLTAPARRRARPGQRLHARPASTASSASATLHRLGDGDPQPARAVAGRARASTPPRTTTSS